MNVIWSSLGIDSTFKSEPSRRRSVKINPRYSIQQDCCYYREKSFYQTRLVVQSITSSRQIRLAAINNTNALIYSPGTNLRLGDVKSKWAGMVKRCIVSDMFQMNSSVSAAHCCSSVTKTNCTWKTPLMAILDSSQLRLFVRLFAYCESPGAALLLIHVT